MKVVGLIILSIALNLALVSMNCRLQSLRRAVRESAPRTIPIHQTMKRTVRDVPRPLVSSPAISNINTNAPMSFHWGQLESEDYFIYAANLRGIGCPERRVRHILLADVEKYFEARHEALNGQFKGDFWRVPSRAQRAAQEALQERQELALHDEQARLVRDLVSVDLDTWQAREEINRDKMAASIVAMLIGYLPEGKPEKVFALVMRQERVSRQFESETHGITLPEDETRARELHQQFKIDLAQVFDPTELAEFRRRLAVLEGLDIDHFAGAGVTGAEIRTLADLHVAVRDPFDELFLKKFDVLTDEQQALIKTQFDEQTKKLLGPARYAAYEREKDDFFQKTISATEGAELPKATAISVYEIQQALAQEARRLTADGALTPEQRQTLFAAQSAQALAAAQRVLGAEAFAALDKQLGGWGKYVQEKWPEITEGKQP